MHAFPAFLDLVGRKAVVVGSGPVAASKARLLADAGADVSRFGAVEAEGQDGRVLVVADEPVAQDFAGARLVVVAVESEADAARFAAMARRAGALVNAIDRPALSDFALPAIVDRGEVVVAVSTAGAAPVLARRLRAQMEALLPERLGALAAFARAFRPKAAHLPAARRRAFWERLFDGPAAAKVLDGDDVGAWRAAEAALSDDRPARGVVHIVGAGPGDPDLLTLRALRLISDADVIVYDRLVGAEILKRARRDATLLYVGKAKGDHAVPQSEIEARLVAYARAGKRVVRLKGGDPFIFGRGGEEQAALEAAGVDVFVTPGITAALGCAASAGMPLTHRGVSQATTFVTGHARDDGEPDVDWTALAQLKHTLVVYMGVDRAADIQSRLIAAGRAPTTPIAIIENGTRTDEKILRGVLADLGGTVARGEVRGPALLVIGEVAALGAAAFVPERAAA